MDHFTKVSELTKLDENIYELTDDITYFQLPNISTFDGTIKGNGYCIKKVEGRVINELQGTIQNVTFEVDSADYVITENLGTLKNCTIRRKDAESTSGGGICKKNNNLIVNCTVLNGSIVRDDSAGLISGFNGGEIKNCKVEGEVIGKNAAGGICGQLLSGGSIKKCSSSAYVKSQRSGGGIVGVDLSDNSELVISDCSVEGKIDSHTRSGIFVGETNPTGDIIYKECSSNVSISSDYVRLFESVKEVNQCDLNIQPKYNGILFSNPITVLDSSLTFRIETMKSFKLSSSTGSCQFANTEMTITAVTVDKDLDIPKQLQYDDSKMRFEDSFVSLNKEIIEKDPIYVTSEEDLYNCTRFDTIYLEKNITLTEENRISEIFYGEFNGNGYTITNVSTPLFGRIAESGVISDITISDSHLRNPCYRNRVGFIAKQNLGLITNITIRGGIIETENNDVGSIVGNSIGQVVNSTICDTTIIGTRNVGGVCGYMKEFSNLTVTKCSISGIENVGGIFGQCDTASKQKETQLSDSKVSGEEFVGGIGGYTQTESDTHVVEDSFITGEKKVGGVFGIYSGTVHTCKTVNTKVRGEVLVGGFAGSVTQASVTNVTVDAEVITNISNGGGLMGELTASEVKNCKIKGSVRGSKTISGCLSRGNSITLEKIACENTVEGKESVVAFIQDVREATIKKSYTVSTVYTDKPRITQKVKDSTFIDFYWNENIIDIPQDDTVGTSISDQMSVEELKTIVL